MLMSVAIFESAVLGAADELKRDSSGNVSRSTGVTLLSP